MSQLSDILNKAIDDAGEGFDARIIADLVWQKLDDKSRRIVGLSELVKRLKQAAALRWKVEQADAAAEQQYLPFDLPGAVPMDSEGHRIRRTLSLSQAEFKRAGDIREDQIQADRKALREWREAEIAARPYWNMHPDWTFGQCLDALIADKRKGDGRAA